MSDPNKPLAPFTEGTLSSVERWAAGHRPGSRGAHDYDLTLEGVRERFADYLACYDATA